MWIKCSWIILYRPTGSNRWLIGVILRSTSVWVTSYFIGMLEQRFNNNIEKSVRRKKEIRKEIQRSYLVKVKCSWGRDTKVKKGEHFYTTFCFGSFQPRHSTYFGSLPHSDQLFCLTGFLVLLHNTLLPLRNYLQPRNQIYTANKG